MQFILWNIFFALFSAFAGVLIGWFVADPDRIPQWIALNKLGGGNWEGEWWCIWQHPDNKEELVIDQIQLMQRFGRLKIKVVGPGSKYNWEGIGALKAPYFIGEWRSVKFHSNSRGTFTFDVLPQGDRMVGFFIGPDYEGNPVSLEALITADNELVERIKGKLEDLSNAKHKKSFHEVLSLITGHHTHPDGT
jgi:hypothetical protein